jgi:hypothetical protein
LVGTHFREGRSQAENESEIERTRKELVKNVADLN